MNKKRLFAPIISAVFILSCLCACAPKDVNSASSHISAESEHNHEHEDDKTQNTASKKPSNKNDKNTSSKTVIGIQRPNISHRDENVDYDKYAELPSQGKNISQKLFDDYEARDNKTLYFFNVKNTTYASTSYVPYRLLHEKLEYYKEIEDEQQILDFKQGLSLYAWTAKKFTAKTEPEIVIYFDDKYHLNVEGKVDGAYWLSLNASYGKVYYIVPEAVYNYVVAFSR